MGCKEVERDVQGGSEELDDDQRKSYWCNDDENKVKTI